MIKDTLKKLGIIGLVVTSIALGVDKCSSVIDRPTEGRLASGLNYKFRKTTNPNSMMVNDKSLYVIEFGDGITVRDAFDDGWIGPYDVTDPYGQRIVSQISFEGHEKSCAMRLDNELRGEILQRIQEVYNQQGHKVNVSENWSSKIK